MYLITVIISYVTHVFYRGGDYSVPEFKMQTARRDNIVFYNTAAPGAPVNGSFSGGRTLPVRTSRP